MKKNILNLSILMLLSSSFNAFGSENISDVAKIAEDATNLAVAGILDSVVDGGVANTEISEAVADNIAQLTSSGEFLSQLNPALRSNFTKFVGRFVDFVPETVKQKVCAHPVISAIAGGCALAGTGYLVNRAIQSKRADTSSSAAASSQSNLGRFFASLAPSFSASATSSSVAEVDQETQALYDKIDSEIAARGDVNAGEGDENRTLLMSYAINGNLPAVKYLVEQKNANVNAEDIYYKQGNPGRTALALAGAYGHADVVQYLADKSSPGTDTSIARIWATNVKDETKAARILAVLDLIDANTAAALAGE